MSKNQQENFHKHTSRWEEDEVWACKVWGVQLLDTPSYFLDDMKRKGTSPFHTREERGTAPFGREEFLNIKRCGACGIYII